MTDLEKRILEAGLRVVEIQSDTTLASSYRQLQFIKAQAELFDLLRTYKERSNE
jgi:hypothetical protein